MLLNPYSDLASRFFRVSINSRCELRGLKRWHGLGNNYLTGTLKPYGSVCAASR